MKLNFGTFEFEARMSSLHPWTHFKLHKHDYYNHLVFGKLSVIYGQPGLTPIQVCKACMEEVQRVGYSDESLDYCESCHQLEPDTLEITTAEYEQYHG